MISFDTPMFDDRAIYNAIAQHRGGSDGRQLANLSAEVFLSYEEYESLSVKVCDLVPGFGPPDDELLRSNWKSFSLASLKDVRSALLKSSPNTRCCFCNNAKAGELDHYLPKSKFPELAVYTRNLLPACHSCNNKKRAKYQRSNPKGPAFLHPVVHRLPNSEQFLQVEISIESTVIVEYFVQQTASMPDGRFHTLRSHFDGLELASLYRDEAINTLTEILGSLYAYRQDSGGPAAVARYLDRDAASARSKYGLNHWKPVLLASLAADSEFCDAGFTRLRKESLVS